MKRYILFPVLAAVACGLLHAAPPVKSKPMQVESIVLNKKLWDTKIEDFTKQQKGRGFEYMSGAKDALRAEGKGFKFYDKGAGEVVLRAEKGNISSASIFLFNRGDNGDAKLGDFLASYQQAVAKITAATGQKPRDISKKGAVDLTRMLWMWENSAILLEKSISNNGARPEFLRIRMKAQNARSGGMVNRRQLRDNVVQDRATGDVFIENIPMIDQGKKGYCAVASAARVYQYYGLETDQHILAQIAGTGPSTGTSLGEMVFALKKVTGHVHSRGCK